MLFKMQLSSDNPSYTRTFQIIQMRSESKDLKICNIYLKDYIESGGYCAFWRQLFAQMMCT